jgi:hypothetical protein
MRVQGGWKSRAGSSRSSKRKRKRRCLELKMMSSKHTGSSSKACLMRRRTPKGVRLLLGLFTHCKLQA